MTVEQKAEEWARDHVPQYGECAEFAIAKDAYLAGSSESQKREWKAVALLVEMNEMGRDIEDIPEFFDWLDRVASYLKERGEG